MKLHFKIILMLCIVSLLFVSCEKTEIDDPRDKYVDFWKSLDHRGEWTSGNIDRIVKGKKCDELIWNVGRTRKKHVLAYQDSTDRYVSRDKGIPLLLYSEYSLKYRNDTIFARDASYLLFGRKVVKKTVLVRH